MTAQDFAPNRRSISGSHIGSRPEALGMLKLASEKNIMTWAEEILISEKGCKEAVEKLKTKDLL
jgi:alcohol dehydrogenase (NADP+)